MSFPSPAQSIQMVMSDVDGTLITPDKQITKRAKESIRQLRQAGVKFTVISGRASYGLRAYIEELSIDQPIVSFNGGMLALPDGTVIEKHLLAAELLPEVLRCLERFGLVPFLFAEDCWFVPSTGLTQSPDFPYVRHEADLIQTEPIAVDSLEPYYDRVLKLTGVSGDFDKMGQCQKAMQELLGNRASALCSQAYYLDVTHRLANKGHAVRMVAEYLGLSSANIAVIGDMPSDVPMFEEAGYSIAMGNADPEVRNRATAGTASNQEEGFARAIEGLLQAKSS